MITCEISKVKARLSPLPLSLVLYTLVVGCTDLESVRSFAKLSASAANYQQVVTDFVESPKRQIRYQPANQDQTLLEIARRRTEQKKAFADVQNVIVSYMNSLGDLAGDQVATIDTEVDGVTAALEKVKFVGEADKQIGKETASAAGTIAKKLGNAILQQWRKSKIRDLIRETDEPLQNTIAGFTAVLDKDLRSSLRNEEVAVKKPFQAWKAASGSREDRDGAPPVADILMDERVSDLKTKEAQLDAYISALRNIAKGHHSLYTNSEKLDSRSVITEIKAYSKDIQSLKKAIEQLASH